jgi:hypothetical protein
MLLSGITQIGKKPLEAPKEPGKFVVFITGSWRFENVAAFSMNLAVLSFFTFLFSQLYNESQDSMELLWLFYPLLFIYPLMRKKDALKSVFSKIFFTSAFILIVLTGIFFGFHIITSTGFLAISLITVPTFTLLYAWAENFPKQTTSHSYQAKNNKKSISTIFVLAGIILLIFSFSSYFSYRTKVRNSQSLRNYFESRFQLNPANSRHNTVGKFNNPRQLSYWYISRQYPSSRERLLKY